jgi:DNA uptake protein ComE-like DNA-binding protein
MKGNDRMKKLTTACTLLLLSTVIGACDGGSDTADEITIQEAGESTASSGSHLGLVNPNLASEQELLALEGISEGAVSAITDAKPFSDMVSLDNTLDRLLEAEIRATLYEHMWIPMNLNTASEEEMLLIPGVGDRLAHEFDEYRPYVSMEQFEREIGKYVDDSELARLSRYVTLAGN